MGAAKVQAGAGAGSAGAKPAVGQHHRGTAEARGVGGSGQEAAADSALHGTVGAPGWFFHSFVSRTVGGSLVAPRDKAFDPGVGASFSKVSKLLVILKKPEPEGPGCPVGCVPG